MARPWIYAIHQNRLISLQIGGPPITSKRDLQWLKRALEVLDDFSEPDPQPELAAAMECYGEPVNTQS